MRFRIAFLLFTIVGSSYALEPERKSIWKRLADEPPLPAELRTDADVYPMARTVTARRPLSFTPFSVSKLRKGWVRSDISKSEAPLSRSGRTGEESVEARQKFSFTLKEHDNAVWACQCEWSGTKESLKYSGKTSSVDWPTSTTLHLQCQFAAPDGEGAWSLEWAADAETQGLGMKATTRGRLIGPASEFRVEPIFVVENSKSIGDVPAGYAFRAGESAVAAAQTRGPGAPYRFVSHRSLSHSNRSILAAASAALLLSERFVEGDLLDSD